jgi:ribonuclease HII
MNIFFESNKIEVGLDEAGRGCLFGPVFTAGVIWNGDYHPDIRDSKKLSLKKRNEMKEYILNNAISYNVTMIDNNYIDKHNILRSTIRGWHDCISHIHSYIPVDTILVDGPNFDFFIDNDFEAIDHVCINDGDNKYIPIAAASILAKTFRDEYINKLVDNYPELEKYDIRNNKGYGTKKHMDAIKKYGSTQWHRMSFGPLKKL